MIKNMGIIGSDGYVDVADQLGISRIRDRIEVRVIGDAGEVCTRYQALSAWFLLNS
ncbi:hypothetical protein F4814DRAFT_452982 [Daldinia grandis]|nr:hypothetical protein F4814DRAFT_452982 [Daldinia grandis]